MIGTAASALRHPGQAIGAMPAALAQVATTPPTPKDFDPIGLSMYFSVHVHGLNLGKWGLCTGIGVKLSPRLDGPVGGDYQSQAHLPGQLSFPMLTLERAIHKNESATVQKWLRNFVKDWVSGDGTAEGTTATIILKDANHREVARWQFTHVYPESWTGPELRADFGNVATEKLTLAHGGFLPDGPKASEGELKSEKSKRSVTFKMPPTIVVSRGGSQWRDLEEPLAPGGPNFYWAYGNDTIELSEVRLYGPQTEKHARLLQDWATTRPEKESEKGSEKLPVLLFTWGDFAGAGRRAAKVTLNGGVSLTYTRFSATGKPLAAKISNLKLRMFEPHEKPTNPSSGGITGRAAHRLISGETLPHVAHREYGRPGLWRALARVNGIDDPSSLRPGTLIYLPPTAELVQG